MSCSRLKQINVFDTLSGVCVSKKNRIKYVTKQSAKLDCFTLNHALGKLSDRTFLNWDDARCSYKNGVNYNKNLWVNYSNRVFYLSHDENFNPISNYRVSRHVTPYEIVYYFLVVDYDGRLISKTIIERKEIIITEDLLPEEADGVERIVFTYTQYFRDELLKSGKTIRTSTFIVDALTAAIPEFFIDFDTPFLVIINNLVAVEGIDFQMVDGSVVWISTEVDLVVGDKLKVVYFK